MRALARGGRSSSHSFVARQIRISGAQHPCLDEDQCKIVGSSGHPDADRRDKHSSKQWGSARDDLQKLCAAFACGALGKQQLRSAVWNSF